MYLRFHHQQIIKIWIIIMSYEDMHTMKQKINKGIDCIT